MSIPSFDDAVSTFRDKVSNFTDYLAERLELRRKKYRMRRMFTRFKDYLRDAWSEKFKPGLNYVFTEFLWITLANGLVLNIPFNHFVDWVLTPYSVVAFGCVWYALFVMVPDLVSR